MGIKQIKVESKVESFKIDEVLFIHNINQRGLNDTKNFSVGKMKYKAISLFEDAKKLTEDNDKYLKLKEAISYDNTNTEIMENYLKLAQKCNNTDFKLYIKLYSHYISPEIYETIAQHEKEKSSLELFNELFAIIKNYDIINKDIVEEFKEKGKILDYFYNIKGKEPIALNSNSTYSAKTNLELALYEVYYSLFQEFNKKIGNLWEIITNVNSTVDQILDKIVIDRNSEKVIQLLNKNILNKSMILLFKSTFFDIVLPNVRKYVLALDDTIKTCLELKDKQNDFYMLLFISLEIKYMVFHNKNANFTDRIKEYKNNNIIDVNDEIKEKIKTNEILSKIKNLDEYNVNRMIKEIDKENYINEYILYKYIKLEYYNSNNIIQKMMGFVQKFNKRISNSKTIKDVLNGLYPQLKTYNIFNDDFCNDLFDNAIKNCYFFPFIGKKSAMTLKDSGTICFFIHNKTDIKEEDLFTKNNIKLYLIGNLGVFIYIELHEILGHHLRKILSNITNYEFISPRGPKSNNNESGECIEYLLFGNRISSFTIYQLLYILDVKNYDKDIENFRNDFININSKNFSPSDDLLKMLKENNIDLGKELINDDETIKLFQESFISEKSFFAGPEFEDCIERHEIVSGEINYK